MLFEEERKGIAGVQPGTGGGGGGGNRFSCEFHGTKKRDHQRKRKKGGGKWKIEPYVETQKKIEEGSPGNYQPPWRSRPRGREVYKLIVLKKKK